jgi:hypothetical protein
MKLAFILLTDMLGARSSANGVLEVVTVADTPVGVPTPTLKLFDV